MKQLTKVIYVSFIINLIALLFLAGYKGNRAYRITGLNNLLPSASICYHYEWLSNLSQRYDYCMIPHKTSAIKTVITTSSQRATTHNNKQSHNSTNTQTFLMIMIIKYVTHALISAVCGD